MICVAVAEKNKTGDLIHGRQAGAMDGFGSFWSFWCALCICTIVSAGRRSRAKMPPEAKCKTRAIGYPASEGGSCGIMWLGSTDWEEGEKEKKKNNMRCRKERMTSKQQDHKVGAGYSIKLRRNRVEGKRQQTIQYGKRQS